MILVKSTLSSSALLHHVASAQFGGLLTEASLTLEKPSNNGQSPPSQLCCLGHNGLPWVKVCIKGPTRECEASVMRSMRFAGVITAGETFILMENVRACGWLMSACLRRDRHISPRESGRPLPLLPCLLVCTP